MVDLPRPLSPTPETMELEVVIKGASPTEPIFYQGTVVMSQSAPSPRTVPVTAGGEISRILVCLRPKPTAGLPSTARVSRVSGASRASAKKG